MGHIKNICGIVRNLANEAEMDEQRHIARHRRIPTRQEKLTRTAHITARHCIHVLILTGAGLPAILAFELGRPLWVRYVELPLWGHAVSSTAEMLSAMLTL